MARAAVGNGEIVKEIRRKSTRSAGARSIAIDLAKAVTKASAEENGGSKALDNPWEDLATVNGVIEPPYDPYGLAIIEENSNELRQCIETMDINIPGYGWRLVRTKASLADELDDVAADEFENFFEFLTYSDYDEKSFTNLRRRTRHDVESSGNAYWEIVRDGKGDISCFRLITHFSMRIRSVHPDPVEVVQNRPRGVGEARHFKRVTIRKRFRTYVQARENGGGSTGLVYFKAYGDPRVMDLRTGKFETEEAPVPVKHHATEIVHWSIYSSRTPYGIPRYIGAMLAIFGSRAAEEINYTTFKNNLIPSLAFMVSNGEATDDTITRISEFMASQVQGSDNYSKFLLLEAEPYAEDGADNVKMEIKELTKNQHTDELFQNYDKNNQAKTRQSFRLPPLYTGQAGDYSRATAETSRKVADEQVFDPERRDDDWTINRILRDMGLLHHEFATNTPNVTNDQDLIAVMNGAERVGAMTPRVGHAMLEDIMSKELPKPEGIDLDVPFSKQMAEAVKNLAKPNEVGQQVTALKAEEVESSWLDRIMSAQTVSHSEGDGRIETNVALNAGSQAIDLSDGTQKAFLSPLAVSLSGREMFVSDGLAMHARVKFGTCKRVDLHTAAAASGLTIEDVQRMYPGKVEIWCATIEARDSFAPVSYEHPDTSLFKVVTRAKP